MSSFKELTKDFKKDYGDMVGGEGFAFAEIPRLPTGIFALDLALGGGIPMGKATELYGRFASGKTNLAYKLIANHQKLYPKKKCVLIDTEISYDKKWAAKFGVDIDALYMFRPDYGEAAIDMIEGLIASPECGLVVLDSLAAMQTTRELGNSAEVRDVGGPAFLVTALMRKVIGALSRAEKEDNLPTFIGINQLRLKIGSRGDPETTPGGEALRHMVSLKLRLYGKEVKDPKYHKELPVINDINFIIKKKKFAVVSVKGDFQMALVPHRGLKVGDCDDFNLLKRYMEESGILEKHKNKWVFAGEEEFNTLKELKEMLEGDYELYSQVREAIIEAEIEKANGEESFDLETGEIIDGESLYSKKEQKQDRERKKKKNK